MSVRTTSAAVQAILKKNYDGETVLDPFIESGSSMTDEIVTYCTNNGLDALTFTKLELIERWLSAHFYSVMAQLYKIKNDRMASATFQGDTKMYLESTVYGQQAMAMDPTGYLRSIGGEVMKVARVTWLGKDPIAQNDYEEGVGR